MTHTILIADNEPDVGRFIGAVLSRAGYCAVITTSGREALAAYAERRSPVSLVLIDVVMPEMDGPALARALREVDPNAHVLFMSAYQREHLERYGEDLTGAEILNKPFTPAELLEAVEKRIGKKRSSRGGAGRP